MIRNPRLRRGLILTALCSLGLVGLLFAACSESGSADVTPTPTRTPRPTTTPTPTPTPTPSWPASVFVPHGLPPAVMASVDLVFTNHADLFVLDSSRDSADVRVLAPSDTNDELLVEWTYVLVAPFPTVVDNVDWTELVAFWSGAPTESGPLNDSPLMMTAETATALTLLMGNPDPDSIDIVAAGELMERAWNEQPAMAVVPFEDLEPRWKVLRIDGFSVLDRGMDSAAYPLTLRASLSGLQRGTKRLIEVIGAPLKNRDPERMSVVLMTGVTALTRATAVRMERHGPTYPAEDILPWLLEPDVTHISNEVSFAENCPSPSDYRTMVFCSAPEYIELFEYADIDVIELTGNHVLDWGGNAMLGTLDTYDEVGIPYFGGGRDVAEAQRPLTISAGIHTFGFIGCQIPPSSYAHEAQPGAAPCDYDLIRDQIAAFRQQGTIPIVTLQYWEFYQYAPTLQQQKDFRALAEAGAVIVSGSQAHQPQSFDFYGDTFIHYGLGNLFFDQMWSLETRQEFLDRHVFYNGQHISTELLTAILEDYSRPRPMTSEERTELLTAAFEASPW